MHPLRSLWLTVALSLIVAFLGSVSRPAAAPIGQPTPPLPPPSVGRLTVLDLNMLHGWPHFTHLAQRVAVLQAFLAARGPDLVLLQEVPWRPETGPLARALADDTYAWAFARANGNRYLLRFEEGEAILSHFPILEWEVRELYPRPMPWEHRVVLHARIQLPQGPLHLFVTHLTHRDPEVNARQGALLYRVVAETAQDQPALIAGDFNAEPTSSTIRQLQGWIDLYARQHPQEPGYTCCVAGPEDLTGAFTKRIDYLFYRPGSRGPRLMVERITLAWETPFPTPNGPLWISDHLGLWAEMDVAPAP